MKRCKACEYDKSNGVAQAHGAGIACQRVRSTAKQWWERAPGYVKEEVKAELARAGRAWWPRAGTIIDHANRVHRDPRDIIPIHSMTPKQIVAELKRQSARLAGQPSFEEAA